ncbi:DUF1292 domain-containing protein [Bacillus sp. FJAT-45350]|uniref:DUF1292 domain-containing protein n=1 Tax=Bacillus sp. FJAT-45350 TaxID=2011014 RepID=UPI000BB6E8EF|nr:DUF1292 domain-containing protein [Bacillus sp. FJAT-45350]
MEKVEIGEVFTIGDENDEEQEVEVLAALTIDNIDYVAVSFVEDLKVENDEGIDLFFLKVDNDGDLTAIESDEEFDKVSAAFDKELDDIEGE